MKCKSCVMYEGNHPVPGNIIVDLDGGWTINHYAGSEDYLGWLPLQPRAHKMEFLDLVLRVFKKNRTAIVIPC